MGKEGGGSERIGRGRGREGRGRNLSDRGSYRLWFTKEIEILLKKSITSCTLCTT